MTSPQAFKGAAGAAAPGRSPGSARPVPPPVLPSRWVLPASAPPAPPPAFPGLPAPGGPSPGRGGQVHTADGAPRARPRRSRAEALPQVRGGAARPALWAGAGAVGAAGCRARSARGGRTPLSLPGWSPPALPRPAPQPHRAASCSARKGRAVRPPAFLLCFPLSLGLWFPRSQMSGNIPASSASVT